MFRLIRLTLLLGILIIAAISTWSTAYHAQNWQKTLYVGVYPINGDQSKEAKQFIQKLKNEDFAPIESFFKRESSRYKRDVSRPIQITLGPEINERPPSPPQEGNVLQNIFWSLKLRYWNFAVESDYNLTGENIRIFVLYHKLEPGRTLDHSLGLKKGMIGVVHAFGSRKKQQQNHIVVAHEILHTLGATDKYDPVTNYPEFPDGFAEPEKRPKFPQIKTEIMAGRRPVTSNRAEMPKGLRNVIIGRKTAIELGLIEE